MAGRLTTYSANAILGHLTGTTYTQVANMYLALCTTNPGDAATGASCGEVASAYAYTRRPIQFLKQGIRSVSNNTVVYFPKATGPYSASYWAVVDAFTYGTGHCLAYGAFTSTMNITANYNLRIEIGECEILLPSTESSHFGLTTEYAQLMLNFMFNYTTYAAPDTYITLITTEHLGITGTDISCGINQCNGTGYEEQQLNAYGGSAPAWGAVSARSVSNAGTAVFTGGPFGPLGYRGWGTLIGMEIRTSKGTGIYPSSPISMAYTIAVSTPDMDTLDTGDTLEFAPGTITMSIG